MSKVPVVFVAGLAADQRLWQPVTDALSDIVDPCFASADADSIAAMADEVLSFDLDRFYVAGTSMGSYVAIDVALRGDPRVAGLIVVNGSARAANDAQRERGNGLIAEVRSGGDFAVISERLGQGVSGGKADIAELASRMTRETGAEKFARQQTAIVARKDRRDELPSLGIPTLVVAADDDKLIPPSLNNEIARLVPHSDLHIIAGSGHLSTIDATEELAGIMRSWLVAREASAG